MKGYIKKLTVAALCLSMLLSVGCGGGEGGGDGRAMGRYVESRIDFPREEGEPSQILQRPDGSMDAYYMIDDGTKSFERYHTKDQKNWTAEKLPWKLPAGEFYSSIDNDSENRIYLMSDSIENDNIITHIYREDDSGALQPVNIDWRDATGAPAQDIMADRLAVAENGDLLIGQSWNGIGQYTSEGAFKQFYPVKSAMQGAGSFTLLGNQLYAIDGSEIKCFDVTSGIEGDGVAFDNAADNTYLSAGLNGAVYLTNRNGIFRLTEGGSMWEKLVDGSLTSLAIPNSYFFSLIEREDGVLFLMGTDGQKTQLYQYQYDETVAALPEKELVVYSLYEDMALRQAAGDFQRSNPDTRVNIQVGMGDESSATASDLIRSLNTELLNGSGPDVILLDGMPIQSYIDKGVLSDMSGLLKEIKADDTMNQKVINTFKNKDGVFAVPTKYGVPALIADKSFTGELTDLASLADFASTHPDKPLVGDKSSDRLIEIFLPVCAPAWLKGGQIDEVGLKRFLEELKTIANTPAKSYMAEEGASRQQTYNASGSFMIASADRDRQSDDLYHWAFGRAHAFTKTLNGESSFMELVLALRKQGNGDIILQPGQARNVYIPQAVVGINAGSKMGDSAESFVKLLLSDSQQEITSQLGGMPVSEKAMKALTESQTDNVYMSVSGDYDQNESLEGAMPTPEEKRVMTALCSAVDTPYFEDDTLMEMIKDEARGYFTGEKEIAKTISDIKEATKLYLSE